MEIKFFLDEKDEYGLKYYYTKDEEFSIIERPDNFFLLYKINRKDDCYDWTETYHDSFEECVKEATKIINEQ